MIVHGDLYFPRLTLWTAMGIALALFVVWLNFMSVAHDGFDLAGVFGYSSRF